MKDEKGTRESEGVRDRRTRERERGCGRQENEMEREREGVGDRRTRERRREGMGVKKSERESEKVIEQAREQ